MVYNDVINYLSNNHWNFLKKLPRLSRLQYIKLTFICFCYSLRPCARLYASMRHFCCSPAANTAGPVPRTHKLDSSAGPWLSLGALLYVVGELVAAGLYEVDESRLEEKTVLRKNGSKSSFLCGVGMWRDGAACVREAFYPRSFLASRVYFMAFNYFETNRGHTHLKKKPRYVTSVLQSPPNYFFK